MERVLFPENFCECLHKLEKQEALRYGYDDLSDMKDNELICIKCGTVYEQ